MKKLQFVFSLLVLAGIAITACAPQVQTVMVTQPAQIQTQVVTSVVQQQVTQEVVVTATPATAPLTGTIRVGSWDSADALTPYNNAIKEFEALYPGVTVQLESVPTDYGTKLLAEVASGTAPDIFQVGDGDVGNFAGKGMFEPLTDYISGQIGNNPLDMSVFYPAIADMGKVNGVQYLLTKDYSPLVLYYNKALFDKAGVDYPTDSWTWNDLLTAAQKLTITAGGKATQWGIQIPDSWGSAAWTRGIQPLIYQNGGKLISDDGSTATGYLDSDAVVGAIQWFTDLFNKYHVAPTDADIAALSGQDLFATGKVAMLWTGRWPLGGYEQNPKLNFGTAMLPQGVQRGNSICWAGFGLYSKSQNKVTAWVFLKFMAAGQGAQEFAKYAFTDVISIAELQGLTTDPFNAPIMRDLANVIPLEILKNKNYNVCIDTPLQQTIASYLLGKTPDLKAALSAIAKNDDGPNGCLVTGEYPSS
jgi:multiple sugar transport system substrate-binding protein